MKRNTLTITGFALATVLLLAAVVFGFLNASRAAALEIEVAQTQAALVQEEEKVANANSCLASLEDPLNDFDIAALHFSTSRDILIGGLGQLFDLSQAEADAIGSEQLAYNESASEAYNSAYAALDSNSCVEVDEDGWYHIGQVN